MRGSYFILNTPTLNRLKAVVKQWSSMKEGFKGMQMVTSDAHLFQAQESGYS